MKQILEQLSEAWNMADSLYCRAENDEERAKIQKRMEQITALMEEAMSRTLTKNDEYYNQTIAAFKKNQKDIERFKAGLDRSTQAVRLLTDIVSRVDSLLHRLT
jgi:hypothetical protein